MPLFRQLELNLGEKTSPISVVDPLEDNDRVAVLGQACRLPHKRMASDALALQFALGRDDSLEQKARVLLRANGAARIASPIQVEWNSRLKTCAGRTDYRKKLISLNPMLHQHGAEEIERTFLHELAHLLAQFRSGRKRIPPHGSQWRKACHDLGIGDERRCHTLPFPIRHRKPRFLYRCPNCRREFPRVRQIRRTVACLACCRAHNQGRFDKRFRLRSVTCSGGLRPPA